MSEHVERPPTAPGPRGGRGLDPIWLGAIAFAMFTVGVSLTLTYDFCDFAWQQRLGAWNAWTGTALMVGTVVPLRLWTTSTDKA